MIRLLENIILIYKTIKYSFRDLIFRIKQVLNQKNYILYNHNTNIDTSVWAYSFTIPNYKEVEYVMSAVESLGFPASTDFVNINYQSSRDIVVYFRDESIMNNVLKIYRKMIENSSTIQYVSETADKNFDEIYLETLCPELSYYVKVLPVLDKKEILISKMIKYYIDNGYNISRSIFNDFLFTPDPNNQYIMIFVDSEASAAEVSFLIMSNQLGEIIP